MAFSDKEQAAIRKALVNFFERVGNGTANNSEISVFPYVLNTLVSNRRIQLSYRTEFNKL